MKEETLSLLVQVISLLPNAVHIKNSSHEWVEVNEAFAQIMGYSREELIGKTSFDVMPKNEAEISYIQDNEVLRTQSRNRNIKQLKNHKGEVRWVEAQKCYFKSASGTEFIIGVLSDLTDLKQHEAELIAARERSMQATKSRAVFLANMGGDIHGPMKTMADMAAALRETPLDHRQLEIMNRMELAEGTLFRIIDDVMDYSKLDAGLMKVSRKPFDPNKLAENIALSLGPKARDKRLDLIVSQDPNLPEFLLGDERRIHQILINLAENAIKFTSQGYVHIALSGQTKGEETEILFSVRDTGPGMETQKLKDIVSDIRNTDGSDEVQKGVSGLGLSLCLRLSRLMGGQLDVDSTLGEGTAFHLKLKLAIDPSCLKSKPTSLSSPLLPYGRILLVDDIPANYDALQSKLIQFGLTADYADSAKRAAEKMAIAFAEGNPYTLVFVDYLMPRVDGLLFANSIARNRNYANTAIVALSSVNDTEVKACFTSDGLADYICKPVRKKELEKVIRGVTVQQALNAPPQTKILAG